ncbi:MAG: hypothetical protein HY235_18105 [Acidobacteria bacterium]|nr:hypothetical protein [Acidobacteriota bacterium]
MGLMLAALLAQACVPCHTEHSEALKTHKHFAKGVGCEVCHGASQQHRNAVGAAAPDRVAAPEEVPALCGGCHLAERQAYESGMHGKLSSVSEPRASASGLTQALLTYECTGSK